MVFSVVPQLNAKLVVTPHGLKDLNDNSALFSQPFERSVVSTDDGVVVTYRLNYLEATPTQEGYRLTSPGFNDVSMAGSPALLKKRDMFDCPRNSTPTLKISRVSHTDVNLRLAPSQPLVFDNGTSTFPFETPIKSYGGFLPEKYVDGLSHQKSRHQSVVWVDVFPFSYSTNDSTLRLCTEITYEITFNTPSSLPPGITLPGITLPDTSAVKPPINPNPETNAVMFESANESFLIITVDEFAKSESLQNFATWKRIQGYQTEILSESSWTPDKIQDKIRTRYQNDPNLNYILIVGDNSLVPAKVGTYLYSEGSFPTDKYYGCMDGSDDELPDICRGRWPVSSLDELNTIVSKTMTYEANPPENKEFYSRATHLSYYQKGDFIESPQDTYRFVRTSEEILTHLEEKFGISADRLYSSNPETDENENIISYNGPQIFNDKYSTHECRVDSFPGLKGYVWNKGYSEFVDCLKEGRLYTLYTGHGEEDYWINKFYRDPVFGDSLTSQDVRSLSENLNTSVLFSIACQTGNFSSDCFANAWLTSKGGSPAVIAQSYNSISGCNDVLAVELFNRWLGGKPIESDLKDYNPSVKWKRQSRIGCFLDSALINQMLHEWDSHGRSVKVEYTSAITHCFADPSMVIHSSFPKEIEGVEVTRDSSKVLVDTGSFIGYISLYDMQTCESRRFYGNHGFINTDNPESVCVHIEKDGYRPYLKLGAMESEEPSVGIEPNSIISVSDNLNGTVTIHYVAEERIGEPYFLIIDIMENEFSYTPNQPKGEEWYTCSLSSGQYIIFLFGSDTPECFDEYRIIVK